MSLLRQRQEQSCQGSPPHAFCKKSHSVGYFSHWIPNTQLYSFLARAQKSGCSHERGRERCPRRRWPSWAEGTAHHQGNTLAPLEQWWVHVRIQEHRVSHTRPLRKKCADLRVCQYTWFRFSIPLLVRLYFSDGRGFTLCLNERRKWPLGTAQPQKSTIPPPVYPGLSRKV